MTSDNCCRRRERYGNRITAVGRRVEAAAATAANGVGTGFTDHRNQDLHRVTRSITSSRTRLASA